LDCECDMCIFDLLMSLFLICFQAKPSRADEQLKKTANAIPNAYGAYLKNLLKSERR
jgi:hypothetical protein